MKAITRHALWGGLALGLASLTMGTGGGCGNGYSVNNYEPEQADVVQTADGSYTPSDAGTSYHPDAVQTADGSYTPSDAEPEDSPTQASGWGVYCIRKITPGSTHFGFLTNYSLSDADGINEVGLVAYSDVTKKRFMQEYPGSTEAVYQHSKRNFGNPGDEDALALYVVDNEGNETEFALKRLECESLDKLLELYGKRQ